MCFFILFHFYSILLSYFPKILFLAALVLKRLFLFCWNLTEFFIKHVYQSTINFAVKKTTKYHTAINIVKQSYNIE